MTQHETDADDSYISADDPRPAQLARRPDPEPAPIQQRRSATSSVAMQPAAQAPAQRTGPRTSEETDVIFAEIAAAQLEFAPLTKTRVANIVKGNVSYSYAYANLADVMAAISPSGATYTLPAWRAVFGV